MALDWVASIATAATGGLVGISGVVATAFTARGQRQLQAKLLEQEHYHREATQLQDARRDVYSLYIDAAYRSIDEPNTPGLVRAQVVALNRLILIAGEDVREAARKFNRAVNALRYLPDDAEADKEDEAGKRLFGAEEEMLRAMHKELGIPDEAT